LCGVEGVFGGTVRGEATVESAAKFTWELGISLEKWIGLRENLQETMDFPIKYGVFL